ncbi:hypothetical protein [Streptomyces sp. NBC_00299]|uniref:hypothetical protein n=1 Tax=Streptomyces sp. NBC_00299 TaxID=2975705 RepID=UPI002E2DF447|nr:hypothetical protein [Streptomyces sp. NBC_00299]
MRPQSFDGWKTGSQPEAASIPDTVSLVCLLLRGPAAGRVVDIELKPERMAPGPPGCRARALEGIAELLRPQAPKPEIYLWTLRNWNHEPAKDDEGR